MRKNVIQWAIERNLISKENVHAQTCKLLEECGELSGAILKNNHAEIVDAIGDIQVVLIILAEQLGIDYDNSLSYAYDQIKNRTGKTVNGTFVKDDESLSTCCNARLMRIYTAGYAQCTKCNYRYHLENS